MQPIIVEEPYEFVPPSTGDFWPWVLHLYLNRYMRKAYGVVSSECRNVDRLRASLDAGQRVLMAPNHCRLADPLALGFLSREVGCNFHAMASWHLFKESRLSHFMTRRIGGFSVHREGNDRKAVETAIEILLAGRRPLVVFAEGVVSRHNDQLNPLMEGAALIARTAARRHEKQGDKEGVVVHPLAIRYFFRGDVLEAVKPALSDMENQLSWYSQDDKPVVQRLRRLAEALLAIKEVEYLGTSREGDAYERAERLIEEVLSRIEDEIGIKERAGNVIARVKVIRATLLPDMVAGKVTPEERHRRWGMISATYYLQQMAHYPRDYVRRSGKNVPEHILETVERMEEDFTDGSRVHGPLHVVLQVGEAIPVTARRPRGEADPIMTGIHDQLTEMLTSMSEESEKV